MSEDRLTRIESAIEALVARQATTDEYIARTQVQVEGLVQVIRGMAQRIEASQAETNTQIQTLIEESRDTRNWLRAAQENIQNLFTEIRRLWERLNAA